MSVFSISADPTGADDESIYRAELERQWRAQLEDVTRLSIDVAEQPGGGERRATGATTEQARVARRLLAAARHQMEETEAALRRLEQGTYGICDQCRRDIQPGRLEALPAARLCVSCQRTLRQPDRE